MEVIAKDLLTYCVIWLLSWSVQDVVRLYHIIHNITLGDLTW